MTEEYKYQNKKVGIDENDKCSLKNLVNEEFKKIEKKNGIGYRDDQEIRNAGRNVCNKLIQEIKNDKTKVYGRWALEPLTKLIADLKKEHENMNGMSLFTNNKDKINQVANRIDNAENETLKRLAKNRTTQDSRNIVNKGNETHKDKPMFTMEGGNNYRKQTGNIVFTKESNPVTIHEALKGLFENPDIVYEVDYSECTNQKIKEKMIGLIGTQTCYLRYDKEQKTYTIRDKNGNGISDRAYIWEGVKLIPAGVRARQAYTEQKRQNENLGKIDNNQISLLTKAMLKDIPSAKNLTAEEQKDLVTKTENRITELLKKAKSLGYDLEPECISKKHFGYGHMELHLNSGSSEVDWTVRGNDGSYNKILGKKLDNFIDSNEGEYKTYLTNRVKAKWQELDALTKTETVNVGKNLQREQTKEEKEKSEMDKQQMLYGIGLLEKMVDNYKESEGDSRLDSDDKDLIAIKKLINNAKASIENSNNIDKDAIIKNFLNPIRERWASIKNIAKTYKPQYNELKTVFFGSKNEQISAIRNLGGRNRIFDNTETSFLAEEIEGNEDLGVKKPEIQECIDKIKNRTTMSIYNQDGSINQKVKGRYDNTYASAKTGTDSLITLFVGRGWLPGNWKDEEKEVRKCMDNLKDKLNSIDSQVNNLNLSVDSMIKEQHQKRLELEQKENKTEDEIKLLQSLVYLEDNPEKARQIYKETIEINNVELKYSSLGQIVKGGLLSALGELGGGITGKNAAIYNDIKGYGFRNLSDENAKIVGDLVGDILEEVAILAVAMAIATVTAGVGTAVIMGARATRWGAKAVKYTKYVTRLTKRLTKPIGKIVNKTGNFVRKSKTGKYIAKNAERARNTKLGKNISKIRTEQDTARAAVSQQNKAEILQLWRTENKTLGEMYKLGSLVNKEGGIGIKAVSAIFEGVGFHVSSTVIHNAINGVDLTTGLSDLKGYVQSIAFLGILKAMGQPIQNLTQASLKTTLGEKISENAFGKILQNIGSITGEFGSLTVTDETINVIFEGKLKELTVEDAIHSIGMILGLRAYGKIKQIANLKIKEYNRNKQELKVEIDGKDIIINEGTLDKLTESNKSEQELNQGNTSGERQQQELLRRKEEVSKKKEAQEKKKPELEKRKAELEKNRQEFLKQREANWRSLDGQENNIGKITDILKQGNIITIDGLKYKFTGVKNGKAEFIIDKAAKKSAEKSGKTFSEKVEVSSLEEFLDSRFNLEPGKKGTNSGRYQKLNELINDKVEPLDRLQNKIKNKQGEISTLEEEIARLERGRNTTAHNDYFEQHKNEIVGKNVRIDGVKYSAEHVNADGSIQFKEVDGKGNYTVSSFKQLAEKGDYINGFSDYLDANGKPKTQGRKMSKSELDNHELIRNLISGEKGYLDSRNLSETIKQKRSDLQTVQQELKGLQDKLPASQARQQAIDARAKKGAEINKEIGKLETELNGVNRELGEADRLVKKYQDEIDGIEKGLQETTQTERNDKGGRETNENVSESETKLIESRLNSELEKLYKNEIRDEIRNKIPDILTKEQKLSIISEFSNKPELHQNFIKTKVIKNLLNYAENIKKSGENPDLIEVLKGSKEELSNISYEQRIELINNINSYLKSTETANRFISIEKSGGASAKELFLRAKGLNISEIKNFEGNVTIEQFRNSVVFVFEKSSDIQRFFGQNGNGNHFENKIPGLDTIVINKENCKNAEKIGLKEEDAISRTLQHESQHAINEIFMPKSVQITEKEAIDPTLTNINTVKEYALNRVKNEIVAQWTNRLFFNKLSTKAIAELSKGGGIKELLTKNGSVYDYFGNRKNTPEGRKAREEYKKEVEKMCDYIDETLKSCKSNEEIQDMLNMFCTTDVKERKNIKDTVKSKEQQRRQQEQQRRQREEEQKRQREEQERREREGQEIKQKEEKNEPPKNEYTENIKYTENIDVDYSKWNMSKEVKEYFDKTKFEKPFFEVDIDGQKIFLTRPHSVQRYTGFIGFVEVNGQYQIRCFIKSGSEGLWRCCPGYREEIGSKQVSKLDEFNPKGMSPEIEEQYKQAGFNFTGNFSYERSTMVDFRLQQIIDDIYVETYSESGKYYDPNRFICATELDGFSKKFDPEMAKRCIDMSKEIDIIDDFSNNFRKKFSECTIDEVKNTYKTETLGIDINSFKIEKGKKYQYYHEEFDCWIDVEVYTAKMGGKDVEIFFSHTEKEPDLIWIDNIQYKNQTINSYGIPSQQINAGWLTKKPIDYTIQCPKGYKGTAFGFDYMDIRPLYQESPIIKKYKELSQQSRVVA